jgi:hypothetical protein
MSHVRSQIRAAIVAQLAGLATTGARVYSGRTRALAADHEPTLLVYAIEETSDVDAMGEDPPLMRTVTVRIEGRAVDAAAADLEETLDQVAAEVEVAMAADFSLGGLSHEVTLTATRLRVEAPGDKHAGEVTMDYRVAYRTRERTPHVAA